MVKPSLLLAVILCATPALALAKDSEPAPPRLATLVVGFGNSMGGLGLQAEGYFARGRASFFGGVGYIPRFEDMRNASGLAGAGGARFFSAGARHRLFLEASISVILMEACAEGSGVAGEAIVYGPGVALGYQYVKQSGFTGMVSAGVGHTIGGPSHVQGTGFLVAFGLGYTWLRR